MVLDLPSFGASSQLLPQWIFQTSVRHHDDSLDVLLYYVGCYPLLLVPPHSCFILPDVERSS